MRTKDNLTPWNQFDEYRGKYFNGEWPTLKELFVINTMRYSSRQCWVEFAPKYLSLTYKEAEDRVKKVASFIPRPSER